MSHYRHTWDGDSNRDLLIAMTEVVSPSAEQIRSIVEITTAMGYSFTPKAVSYFIPLPSIFAFTCFLFYFHFTFSFFFL